MNGKIICSDIIKQRRKELGMTQAQLAEKLYVTNKAVSKWETGEANPDISLLLPLSNALNISLDELLGNGNSNNRIIEQKTPVFTMLDRIKYILCIIGIIPSGGISILFLLCSIFAFNKSHVIESTGDAGNQAFLILFSSIILLIFSALTVFLFIKANHLNELFKTEKRIHLRKLAREKGCILYSDLSKSERKKLNKTFVKKYPVMIISYIAFPLFIPISALTVNTAGIAIYITGMVGHIIFGGLLILFRRKHYLKNNIYYR